jgi:hypothetical protein
VATDQFPCRHRLCCQDDGQRREVRPDGGYDTDGAPRWVHLNGSYYCRTADHVRLPTTAEPVLPPPGPPAAPEWPRNPQYNPRHR